jgi:F0F1-type ATP synthase membrane subunit b/b'
MPQLDFIHYPAQIFWFGLCFIALYLSAHFVILPRIRSIISRRNDLIENDKSLAEELEKQIELINNQAQENLQKANREYSQKIEEITKESHLQRDKSMVELKNKIEVKVKETRGQIKKFIDDSKASNSKVIQDLTQIIKNKITN